MLAIGLIVTVLTGFTAAPTTARTVCSAGGDVCPNESDTFPTPMGQATVTVTADNMVTVHLDPTAPNTLVIGFANTLTPGVLVSGCPRGCGHTSLDSTGGMIN